MANLTQIPVLGGFAGNRHPDLLRLHNPEAAQHVVQFYEDDSFICENVAFLVAKALAAGDAAVVVATAEHRQRIRKRLESWGLDLDAHEKSGLFMAADAGETLQQFMRNDEPDERRFDEVIGTVIRGAESKSGSGFVFAFGEMVALLCADGKAQAAIHLEQLWNALSNRHRFSLYCAYSIGCLSSISDPDLLVRICAEHALAVPSEV